MAYSRDGLVGRQVYQEIPPKVEYSISDYGRSLGKLLNDMCEWGYSHLEHAANVLLDDVIWWARTLRAGRLATR